MKKFPINRSNIIIVILALVLAFVTFIGASANTALKDAQAGRAAYKFSEDKIDILFPFDEEEAGAIDESEPIRSGETWAIYMYLNASNLELDGHSQLSPFVEYIAGEEADSRIEAEKAQRKAYLAEFIETSEKNGIPMPIQFYEADYIKGEKAGVPEEQHSVSKYSWGSDILETIKNAEFPENVTFVVQPAGAKAWKNQQVNPNRTRRFVKSGNELVEVYDAPVSNMGNSETLTDFLVFCRENYPADHTMVILTDHGGAMTGFGWDNVYKDDNLTLKELTEAFDNAYGVNEKKPPIDLLYFNACLMSNTDVINAMRGVCKYMIAGEEVGLSVKDYYGTLGAKLCEKPDMNAKQLGKTLIDCYARDLVTIGSQAGAPPTTGLCLLDMSKAPKVYDAYASLAGKILADAADNPRILAMLSRGVAESISFAEDSYKRYNLTDLGLWISEAAELYPDEAKAIVELIDEAVIYSRADSYLKDAQGISVYYPNFVEDTASLSVALKYINEISYSEDISALYYYKLAGCLNEKYAEYCEENGIKVPAPINYGAMSVLRNSEVTATDESGNVKATIDEAVYPILTDARYELAKVSADGRKVTSYGEDRFVGSDGDKGIETEFEGKWVNLGGTPLYVRVINTYDDIIIYESPVIYKDFEYKLMLQCVIQEDGKDVFTILGLRHHDDEAATIDRNVTALKPGSYVTPIYYEAPTAGGQITEVRGSAILYNINTRIQDEPLEKGTYRARIVYENMRGEDVYSAPVYFDVK